MIKFDNTAVMNFENAMRGARNPLNSWARSDSSYDENGNFVFGPNDLDLAKRLCQAGNDHRKFIRQIFISVDITAPIYWWKEYDTYKVGTVANSTSTMHKIHSKPFELSDFSTDHMTDEALEAMKLMVASLENIRLKYMDTRIRHFGTVLYSCFRRVIIRCEHAQCRMRMQLQCIMRVIIINLQNGIHSVTGYVNFLILRTYFRL